MRFTILFASLLCMAGIVFSQQDDKQAQTKIKNASGNEVEISSLGYTRIVLKDGSIKKNCTLREIKTNGVVYLKEGVLHDMQIDKIRRIELEDGFYAIYFDEKNQAAVARIKD